jgi:2-amino-4-hydroxy-6-hydroxymethyldihydropteridine diphosphokinase
MKETDVCILLGSNLGNRQAFLSLAINEIVSLCGKLVARSDIYETEPWGFEGTSDFLNQVIIINSALAPLGLLETLLQIETNLGRKRNIDEGYVSRFIDIDILYYGDIVIDTEVLSIPHPRLHFRRFTLVPLVELLPDFIHPVLQKSNTELLQLLDDSSPVKLYAKSFSV